MRNINLVENHIFGRPLNSYYLDIFETKIITCFISATRLLWEISLPKKISAFEYLRVNIVENTVIILFFQNYKNYIDDESKLSKEELDIRNYGKIDPKRHLEEQSEVLNGENIVQCLSAMLSTIVFQ